MPEKTLKWCFALRNGLKIAEPNERLAISYLEQAKTSLKRAHEMFESNDFLWTTVIIYYAEYYALYSFLQRLGIKCENHFCSILAVKNILGEEKTKIIEEHRGKRINAQYYMKIVDDESLKNMLKDAKMFILDFDNIISGLSEKEVDFNRNMLKRYC